MCIIYIYVCIYMCVYMCVFYIYMYIKKKLQNQRTCIRGGTWLMPLNVAQESLGGIRWRYWRMPYATQCHSMPLRTSWVALSGVSLSNVFMPLNATQCHSGLLEWRWAACPCMSNAFMPLNATQCHSEMGGVDWRETTNGQIACSMYKIIPARDPKQCRGVEG